MLSPGEPTEQLEGAGQLEKHFGLAADDGLEFLERREGLHEGVEFLVDEGQVVERLQAVRLHADGLQVVFLGAVEVVLVEKAVALVDQRLAVVPVELERDVAVLFGAGEVALEQVEEREVAGRLGHHAAVLFLERLEQRNGRGDVPLLDEDHRLGHFELGLDFLVVRVLQHRNDPVVPLYHARAHHRRYQPGRVEDQPAALVAPDDQLGDQRVLLQRHFVARLAVAAGLLLALDVPKGFWSALLIWTICSKACAILSLWPST